MNPALLIHIMESWNYCEILDLVRTVGMETLGVQTTPNDAPKATYTPT